MSPRTQSALRCGVLCVAVVACASFACGFLIALFDAAGTTRGFSPLSTGLTFAQLGALLFGVPTAIISGVVVWLRGPESAAFYEGDDVKPQD